MNRVIIAAQTDGTVRTAAARLAMPLDEWNELDPDEQDEIRATVRRSVAVMIPKGIEIHVGVHYAHSV